jgi:hypothetical protein
MRLRYCKKMKVFISSTCYDLIDLRAELETAFREAGISPVLSDSIGSDFATLPDKNSIETCLANVGACDLFVVILSKRYGPKLGAHGFEDISATHLEYREAAKNKKPITMYVRDRLEGDFSSWKRNGRKNDFKPVWCDDLALFDLLEEHRTLKEKEKNNWFWIFQNSVELKKRLAADFKEMFAKSAADQLFKSGNLPFIVIDGGVRSSTGSIWSIELIARNVGRTAATQPKIAIDGGAIMFPLPSLAPNDSKTFHWNLPVGQGAKNKEFVVSTTFATIDGNKFEDSGLMRIHFDPRGGSEIQHVIEKRKYLGSDGLIFAS